MLCMSRDTDLKIIEKVARFKKKIYGVSRFTQFYNLPCRHRNKDCRDTSFEVQFMLYVLTVGFIFFQRKQVSLSVLG